MPVIVTRNKHEPGKLNRLEKPNSWLAWVCVLAAGGGHTEAQTRKAMSIQDELNRTGKYDNGRITITLEPEVPNGN